MGLFRIDKEKEAEKLFDRFGVDIENYDTDQIKSENSKNLKKIATDMVSSGLYKFANLLTGTASDKLTVNYLSVITNQNFIIIRQNELIIRSLEKIAGKKQISSFGTPVSPASHTVMNLSSLGHSDKTLKEFLNKLIENKIEIVVDVRSKPYSSRVPHFNRQSLQHALSKVGILYLFRGCNLGGLGENVDFDKAIDEVCELSKDVNVVMVCSEGDYKKCHRYNTLTPALVKNGVSVSHVTWGTKNVNEYEKKKIQSGKI